MFLIKGVNVMDEILNLSINEMPQTEFDCSCGKHHNFSVHDMSIRKGAIEDLPKMAEPFKDGKILVVFDNHTYKVAGKRAVELLGYVKLIVIVVAITLVINNVVLINAKIPSPSMEKTLMVKDRLFGFRLAYGINLNLFGYEISEKFKDPERFDIVIFKYPDDESRLFIKRVIGLPGEVVEIKDGKVYIDGSPTPLDDSFIPEKMIGSYGPYTVPENCYFMLGDNRNDSKDSRSWKNKFVRFDQIVGKAVVRYYPSFKWLG